MSFNPSGTVRIEVMNNTLVLPVNPDQQINHDIRVTVIQTIGGFYFDDFGMGIRRLRLSGTTAFNSPQGKFNGQPVDGTTAAEHLYRDIISYYFQLVASTGAHMYIYDDAFGQAWRVKPIGQLQLSRANNDPLVLNYSQDFVVIEDLALVVMDVPVPDQIKDTLNTKSSIVTYVTGGVSSANKSASLVKQTPKSTYTVVCGDTLWAIAKRYLPNNATNADITKFVNKIVSINKLRNANLIFPGEKLDIPS